MNAIPRTLKIQLNHLIEPSKQVVVFANDEDHRSVFPAGEVSQWVAAGGPMCLVVDDSFMHGDHHILITQDAGYGSYFCLVKKPTSEAYDVYEFTDSTLMILLDLLIVQDGDIYRIHQFSEIHPERVRPSKFLGE